MSKLGLVEITAAKCAAKYIGLPIGTKITRDNLSDVESWMGAQRCSDGGSGRLVSEA